MKKATLEVRDLVGTMDFAAVEKRVAAMPGVASVAMNAGSTGATVEFDEALTNPRTLVCEGQPWRLAQALRIFRQDVSIGAEIVQLESFSGHADGDEILDWVRNARRAPKVTNLTHSEPDFTDTPRGRVICELKLQARVPNHLECIDLEQPA